jgi:hypothetical protein
MQSSLVFIFTFLWDDSADCNSRFSHLLPHGCCIRSRYDIPSCPKVREEKPSDLLVDLLNGWICLCNVCKGIRNCREIDAGGQQSVHASFNLRVHHPNCSLHLDADELLQ